MLQQAIKWIHDNHIDGQSVPITHIKRQPYPEVTGYYIPTLLAIGETTMAESFARWLVSVQNTDGSFSLNRGGQAYVFDTGQVIRGWMSIFERLPELAEPLQRACEWIVRGADPATGRLLVPAPGGAWSLGRRGEISEGIHLYVLQPLRNASRALNLPHIRVAADRALDYYLTNVPATDFSGHNMLSHFYGYMQEAFVELGCMEQARSGMASAAMHQLPSGAVPGYANVGWVCSTGLAQLAKVWYLLGDDQRANRAMAFLAQLQNGSGGFYGSYGVEAGYFPAEEISWAVKYCIDAEQLRIARHFDATVSAYAPTITAEDGRARAILAEVSGARRVLDAGCGKGRYAALVQHHHPGLAVHAVDVSSEMLRHVPASVLSRQASIQDLPYPDGHFDLVYCVEALEHVPNPQAALAEMRRVLAPGGRLLVIDKNLARQGAMQIESWERWFDVDALRADMAALGLQAEARFVGYDGRGPDGLFVAWTGRLLLQPPSAAPSPSVNFYRDSYFDDTNRLLVDACRRGDSAWIQTHLARQDEGHPQPHHDEFFERRFGMQLVAQLLRKAGKQFDVADIACGNAALLRKIRVDGHRVTGVDDSPVRVANNADVPVLHGFCESLPLPDRSFDVLVSQEAMAHVFDLDRALRECRRVLRDGGVLFCQVPDGRWADGYNHVRLFDAESLRSAVAGVGLSPIGLWRIPYLMHEAPNNLFIAAARNPEGSEPGASAFLAPLLASLSGN